MSHANSFNQFILIGRIGQDPELKRSKGKNPTSFSSFQIATYEKFGQKKKTSWHRITVWGEKTAPWARDFLKKGMLVQVTGKLYDRTYTDGSGIKKIITDRRATEVILMARPKSMEPAEEQQEEYAEPEQIEDQEPVQKQEDEEDFY